MGLEEPWRRSPRGARSRLRWSSLASDTPHSEATPPPAARVERDDPPLPDLLSARPRCWLDLQRVRKHVEFGFAGGEIGDALDRVLENVGGSTWDPSCFAADLFVSELVSATPVKIAGKPVTLDQTFVAGVVSTPLDPASRELRRALLSALARPETRQAFEAAHGALRRVRELLASREPNARVEQLRRRLDILAALDRAFRALAATGAHPGLERLSSFGAEVVGGEAFARIGELLAYEAHLATVEIRLTLGADGRVRELALLRTEENTKNQFHVSPLRRFFAQLTAWLSGYRFGADELVARWVDAVFTGIAAHVPALLQLLGHLEVYLFALALKDKAEAAGLAVCFPELGEGPMRVEGLWNPLLFAQGTTPVPCDLARERAGAITIVTGPNSGGKTRLLQAVGLLQLLAEGGFHAPARAARLGAASGMFVSLVEEAKADAREGRLGSELLRIRQLFERAPPRSLVILDELCSGTNPSEGEEIFTLVVSLLRELRPEVFITTHFLGFASRLEASREIEGLEFLQVDLDAADRPTYRFVPGVATTSLAAQTAARLGVTKDELMALLARHRKGS